MSTSLLSSAEVDSLETELGHDFPAIYGDLLTTIGHGDHGGGRTIYRPLEIAELYEFHFENDDDLFRRYFPIGCHSHQQTIWLVDVSTGKVATIYHESHPDDYPDEEWQDPTEWRIREGLS